LKDGAIKFQIFT